MNPKILVDVLQTIAIAITTFTEFSAKHQSESNAFVTLQTIPDRDDEEIRLVTVPMRDMSLEYSQKPKRGERTYESRYFLTTFTGQRHEITSEDYAKIHDILTENGSMMVSAIQQGALVELSKLISDIVNQGLEV